MVSPDSASFTEISVNSASCAANCVVKAAGMCCTRITAAGNSLVKPGTRRMTVAGPPVDAARTTTGKRWSATDEEGRLTIGAGRAIGGAPFCGVGLHGEARSSSNYTTLCRHFHFAQKIFADALHIEIDGAVRLGNKFDGAQFQRF